MAPILSKVATAQVSDGQRDQGPRQLVRRARPVVKTLERLWKLVVEAGSVINEDMQPFMLRCNVLIDRFVFQSARYLKGCWNVCCGDLVSKVRDRRSRLQDTLPIIFVLFLILLLYKGFVFDYMPAVGLGLFSKPSLIFHSFVFLILASFAKASTVDPGSPPNDPAWRTMGRPPAVLKQRKRVNGEARWCRKSHSYKPDRAHFCRVTNRCVLRMDHYCPWLGNTIGFKNHKFFFLFLLYASGTCGMLGMSFLHFMMHVTSPALSTYMLIIDQILTASLSMVLIPFFSFHCWLLVRNLTTIEFCEKMRKQDGAEDPTESAAWLYDVGIIENIRQVMGHNPLLWLLPVGGPAGEGVTFPQASAAASACDKMQTTVIGPSPAVARVGNVMSSAATESTMDVEKDPEATHPKHSLGSSGEDIRHVTDTSATAAADAAFGGVEDELSDKSGAHTQDVNSTFTNDAVGSNSQFANAADSDASSGMSFSLEADSRKGVVAQSDHETSDADSVMMKSSCMESLDCFWVWRDSPAEFQEDLEIGFEYIGESMEDAVLSYFGSCVTPAQANWLFDSCRNFGRRFRSSDDSGTGSVGSSDSKGNTSRFASPNDVGGNGFSAGAPSGRGRGNGSKRPKIQRKFVISQTSAALAELATDSSSSYSSRVAAFLSD
eukprot:TRINITY_DN6133_c0_g1_i1.p1 TRINITY_DN6133_c0_g1~~TRINITY_DN6133_c0_g1_i1.p1  ORF type:complete len:716 (+),score=94.73 TRINITY_DN6133_c0_g1_i1:166-2148(+)